MIRTLTTRDSKVIEFIRDYKIASTSTISELFFSNSTTCYKRLQILSKKELKRMRDSINNEYIYYIKQPKQIKHSLLVTDFYRELYKRAEIIDFKIEPTMGDIRPDAVFSYKYKGKGYLGLLEVEISHKGFDSNKYEKFYTSESYRNYLPVMPTVFIVGNKVKLPENSHIQYKVIQCDFNNFIL